MERQLSESDGTIRRQHAYKILVIGDPGTGKSSIIRRFVHNMFTANYKATIGVDFALKIMMVGLDQLVHLQMWDISGQDRYGVMTRVYYKDAHGAVIVMDSTRDRTVEGALRWKSDLDGKCTLADGSPVPTILLANKSDIEGELEDDALSQLERENGFCASFRTSAKTGDGVDDAFEKLVDVILSSEKDGQYELPYLPRSEDSVRLEEVFRSRFGPVDKLPTRASLTGLDIAEEMEWIESGQTLSIQMLAEGRLDQDGEREVFFDLNGQAVSSCGIRRPARRLSSLESRALWVLHAPMPGEVLEIKVKEGDKVSPKSPLFLLSAMKMEMVIDSQTTGTVKTPGTKCVARDLVVEIEP